MSTQTPSVEVLGAWYSAYLVLGKLRLPSSTDDG